MTAYSISVFSHGIYSFVAQNIEKPKTAIRTGIAEKENRSELSPFQSRFTRIRKYFIYLLCSVTDGVFCESVVLLL